MPHFLSGGEQNAAPDAAATQRRFSETVQRTASLPLQYRQVLIAVALLFVKITHCNNCKVITYPTHANLA